MTVTIRHKRSSTPSAAPTALQLQLGEFSINTYDGIVFFKKNNGADAIVQLATLVADGCILEMGQTISNDYTIPAGKNGLSSGFVTIATGVVLTVSTGSTWSVT